MKVSVILPSYNHAPYLEERIETILVQSFQDFELIILDDKSPDNSADIIEKYRGHDRISHIIINKDNTGNTFKQWDLGFTLAKGEYIWIAESDDYSDPKFLEYCVKALDQNSTAIMCFTDSNFVNEKGQAIEDFHLDRTHVIRYKDQSGEPVVYSGISFVREHMLFENFIYNASMVLFRREAVSKISDFYKTFRGCGDWVFWSEMMMPHDLVHIPLRLNNFRQHTQKVSMSMGQSGDWMLELPALRLYLYNRYKLLKKGLNIEDPRRLEYDVVTLATEHLQSYIDTHYGDLREASQQTHTHNPNPRKMKVYLFGLLPIYKVKYRARKKRDIHYLFGLIPIASVKRY
ncbi:MAG: glycosyltransferase [Rikenellaceae bacterium]